MPTYDCRVTSAPKRVLLAKPRGYCAGVDRAVQTVEEALEALRTARSTCASRSCTTSTWWRRWRQRGAIFVEENEEVPEGSTVIFSAHGVAPEVLRAGPGALAEGDRRHLPAGDEGAPGGEAVRGRRLRHSAHRARGARGGRRHVRRGARAHPAGRRAGGRGQGDRARPVARSSGCRRPRCRSTRRWRPSPGSRQRLPLLQSPPSDDICYATQNRQHVVKEIAAATATW